MNIVIVAHDLAPSEGLALLKTKLDQHGHTATSFFTYGKKRSVSLDVVAAHAQGADIIITGMSSAPDLAEEEVSAAHAAMAAHKPFGFYADSFGTWNRPWFIPFREEAHFLFVLDTYEAADAKKIFGGRTHIVPAGNPLWEQFGKRSETREAVRKKLAIPETKKLILVPGGKDLNDNISLFRTVMHAIKRSGDTEQAALCVCIHPGDRNDPALYTALSVPGVTALFLPGTAAHCSALLRGADLIVACASTVGIEAAFLRIPVIDYLTRMSRERMKKATGRSVWRPTELGASTLIFESTDTLAREIHWRLTPQGAAEMRREQEKAFPAIPTEGSAVAVMEQALAGVVSSRLADAAPKTTLPARH